MKRLKVDVLSEPCVGLNQLTQYRRFRKSGPDVVSHQGREHKMYVVMGHARGKKTQLNLSMGLCQIPIGGRWGVNSSYSVDQRHLVVFMNNNFLDVPIEYFKQLIMIKIERKPPSYVTFFVCNKQA